MKARSWSLDKIAEHLEICRDTVRNYLNVSDVNDYREKIRSKFIPIETNSREDNTSTYCSKFGCGKVLTSEETLYGNKCPEHSKPKLKQVGNVISL